MSEPRDRVVRTIEFERLLDVDNILRVQFELDGGEVLKFTVQLECCFEDEWAPVVRYDTAHGFAHCDRLHPYADEAKTRMLMQDYNEALNWAMADLTSNWQAYRRRYAAWRKIK
jgi:hypothetical protein